MKNNNETDKKTARQNPENLETAQISEEKENQETVKKERCEPCMHCGVHCIFLKEDH